MITNRRDMPLAYFITFSCYGNWLHGGKEISVDKHHNMRGTPYIAVNPIRQKSGEDRMKMSPYLLCIKRREIVLKSIIETCAYFQWKLYAAHIRTNHVHVVISGKTPPEKIMNTLKSYASRYLNKLENNLVKRWTRHGSTRYLWTLINIENTMQYVINEQGEPMAVFEDKQLLNTIV